MDSIRIKGTWIYSILVFSYIKMAQGQDDDTTTTILPSSFPVINDYSEDIIPKTVATVVAFTAAILIGLLVAKLVECWHERAMISDNASDMSDYTRELLKAQLVLAFNKGKTGKKQKPEDIARKYGKLWYGKMQRNKARRIKASKANKELEEGKANTDKKPGNFLQVPPAGRGKKPPVTKLTVIDETKKTDKRSTVTPPTANATIQRTESKSKAPQNNSVAPMTSQGNSTISPAQSADNKTNNNTTKAPLDSAGSATPPSPTKKASVTKTNVASRPISAGLKKPGVARPVSAKSRPPTAKQTQK